MYVESFNSSRYKAPFGAKRIKPATALSNRFILDSRPSFSGQASALAPSRGAPVGGAPFFMLKSLAFVRGMMI